mmetsp:Transcript_11681/g.38490  ORF Transcript_11681/g.38490 Transcript_11681/m.38490 type:complete len:412 (+) Transcript_11681:521-1756(+)
MGRAWSSSVDDGELALLLPSPLPGAYHGWAFDSDGTCTRIPQIDSVALGTALGSPRSCVASLPVAVHKRLLFAWPWGGLPALGEGPGTPEHLLAGVRENVSTYTRDLPYGWDTLVENLIDPAHIPWAHHGLQGKREDAVPITMSIPRDAAASQTGFSFDFGDRTMGLRRAGTGEFRAPYVVDYNAEFQVPAGATPRQPFRLTVVCIPTRAGWSRAIIYGFSQAELPPRRVPPLPPLPKAPAVALKHKKSMVSRIFGLMPVWLVHTLSSRFLDSDLAFLHNQEKELARRAPHSAAQAYFMPAPADQPIIALRRWLAAHAPVLGPLPPPITDRATLLDRWTQHSAHCYHCTTAAGRLPVWRKRAAGTLALSLLFGMRAWPARLVAAGCVGLLWALGWAEQALRFQDYKHYENH